MYKNAIFTLKTDIRTSEKNLTEFYLPVYDVYSRNFLLRPVP